MKTITNTDLVQLKKAIQKDYGVLLEDKELYTAAYSLLKLFEALMKYDQKDKKEVRKSF